MIKYWTGGGYYYEMKVKNGEYGRENEIER
jgi:hypothetical protein